MHGKPQIYLPVASTRNSTVVSCFQLVEGRRVLELGSGVGYLASAMLESCGFTSAPPPTERQLQTKTARGNKTNAGTSSFIGAQSHSVRRSSHRDTGDASTTQESRAPSHNGPASYTATDCHPHVLDLLFHNLSLMDPLKVSLFPFLNCFNL